MVKPQTGGLAGKLLFTRAAFLVRTTTLHGCFTLCANAPPQVSYATEAGLGVDFNPATGHSPICTEEDKNEAAISNPSSTVLRKEFNIPIQLGQNE